MERTLLGVVTLLQTPSPQNGQFYVVERDDKTTTYVSALFGRNAKGLPIGSKLHLSKTTTKSFGAYCLDCIPSEG